MADREREWDFEVFKDIMFDEVAEPEQGTAEQRKRVCVPFPFELTLPNSETLQDFEIHVDGWKNFAYYSPGESPSSLFASNLLLQQPGCRRLDQ